MRYTKKVKYRHGFGIPKTRGYQYYGEKTGFNVRYMFAKHPSALPVLQNILHHYFACKSYNFTCLHILEVDTACIRNYENDKHFSIYAWKKPGGYCDSKAKE